MKKRLAVNKDDDIVKLLIDVRKVLEKNNIFFFPIFGTLLGFVRDNGIISFDPDCDIGVLSNCIDDIVALKPEFEDLGYKCIKKNNKIKIASSKIQKGGTPAFQHIDIFSFDIDDKYMFLTDKPKHRFLKKGFTDIKVYGVNFHIFKNYEEYLTMVYGKNWRTPDPNFAHTSRDFVRRKPNTINKIVNFVIKILKRVIDILNDKFN